MRHTLETYSGLYFDFDDPRPEQVDVADIAKALSWTCRFGGHVSRGISVAEHAVLVYELVQERVTRSTPSCAWPRCTTTRTRRTSATSRRR
jgi:hypothetical protein